MSRDVPPFLADAALTPSNTPENSLDTLDDSPKDKKRKASYLSTPHFIEDVPAIFDFLDSDLDTENKKMVKRVRRYVNFLEKKNATLEAQQKSLVGEIYLPSSSKPLIDKYSGSFTGKNQGQEYLEWILRLIVKDSIIRYDHREKDSKLSKVAHRERRDNFLERGFSKVDKVLEAVMKKKKSRAIATVKGHSEL